MSYDQGVLRFEDRVGLEDARRALLEKDVAEVATLAEALRLVGWTLDRVLVQDEYTHDVVFGGADGLYLVFDST